VREVALRCTPQNAIAPDTDAVQALSVMNRTGNSRLLVVDKGLLVGIMVEVPATALKTAAFARQVDFFSIGTNDLTQYTLAAERGNDAVAEVGDPYDPGVLRLIQTVCQGAGTALVAVCGELAADTRATPLLVGLGVRELSMTPSAIPEVKEAVRATDLREANQLAAQAVTAVGPDAVKALLTVHL